MSSQLFIALRMQHVMSTQQTYDQVGLSFHYSYERRSMLEQICAKQRAKFQVDRHTTAQ